jgi:DNA-binding NtrC family response regulator
MLPPQVRGDRAGASAPASFTVDDAVPMKSAVEQVVAEVERAYLHRLLQRNRGHLTMTATEAGVTRRTLYNKMKTYGLSAADYR